jgi:hypothetical protein
MKVSRRTLRLALEEHGGVIANVAVAFSVSRQTVYNWVERYQLQDIVATSRNMMFDLATDNVYQAVQDGNLDMSKFVLTHMPPPVGHQRWSNRTEITGADGVPLGLSPDVLKLMERMGVEPSDVVKEFEDMIRQQAEVKHE